MTIHTHNTEAMKDNHTIACILAEALLAHGVSEVSIAEEQVYDLNFRHVTIKITRDPAIGRWIITLRDRKHQAEYAEYEIEKEPEKLPSTTRLLPP